MANWVSNKVSIDGNETVTATFKEIQRRLWKDSRDTDGRNDTTAIGRILYGHDADSAHEIFGAMQTKWIFPREIDCKSAEIDFVSAWFEVNEFQDYLTQHLAIVDPTVIVINDYTDESAVFFGMRCTWFENGALQQSVDEIETSEFTIVADDDTSSDAELREQNAVTWEALQQLREQMKFNVLNELAERCPWRK